MTSSLPLHIQFKKVDDNAIIPTKATIFSAGYDLSSPIDVIVPPHSNKLVMTNIAMAWNNPAYYVKLHSRSSIAYKHNVTVEAGVIDYDYRQNVGIVLQNTTDTDFIVNRGDRIAQAIFTHIANVCVEETVEEFAPILDIYAPDKQPNVSRTGGFGSTGRGTKLTEPLLLQPEVASLQPEVASLQDSLHETIIHG